MLHFWNHKTNRAVATQPLVSVIYSHIILMTDVPSDQSH